MQYKPPEFEITDELEVALTQGAISIRVQLTRENAIQAASSLLTFATQIPPDQSIEMEKSHEPC